MKMGCCSSQNAVQENNNQEEENKQSEDENLDKMELENQSQEELEAEPPKEKSDNEEEKVEENIPEEINIYQLENVRVDYNQRSIEKDGSIGLSGQEVSNSANLRSRKNKSKKNLGKKKPFIISEVETSPYKKSENFNKCKLFLRRIYDAHMVSQRCIY